MLDIHGTSRLFCIYMLKCPSTRLYMLDSSMWKLHSILGDWKTVLWLYSEKKWLYSELYSDVKWSVLGINIAQAPSHVLSPTTSCLVNGGAKNDWGVHARRRQLVLDNCAMARSRCCRAAVHSRGAVSPRPENLSPQKRLKIKTAIFKTPNTKKRLL